MSVWCETWFTCSKKSPLSIQAYNSDGRSREGSTDLQKHIWGEYTNFGVRSPTLAKRPIVPFEVKATSPGRDNFSRANATLALAKQSALSTSKPSFNSLARIKGRPGVPNS